MSGATLLFLFGAVDGHSSSCGFKHGLSWYAVVMPAYCVVKRKKERKVDGCTILFCQNVSVHHEDAQGARRREKVRRKRSEDGRREKKEQH